MDVPRIDKSLHLMPGELCGIVYEELLARGGTGAQLDIVCGQWFV